MDGQEVVGRLNATIARSEIDLEQTLLQTARKSLILDWPAVSERSESNGEMSEWLKEHAWTLLWRFAMACCRFRLLLQIRGLSCERATSVDRCKHPLISPDRQGHVT